MKRTIFLLSFLFFFCNNVNLFAQETDSTWHYNWEKKDSTCIDDSWEYHPRFDWRWDWNFDFLKHPTVSIHYGLSNITLKDLPSSFSQPALGEVKVGYTRVKKFKTDYLVRHKFNYLTISNTSFELGKKKEDGKINAEMWRFGFGEEKGFGYKTGSASFVLYNSWGATWGNVKFKDSINNPVDYALIKPFYDEFRFSSFNAGGIKIKPVEFLEIDLSGQRNAIYPAFLFWKASGSFIIEAAAQGLVDSFVGEIFKSSPAAAPIVSFIMKNAVSFAVYELRKEKVNWPFNSPTPLIVDTYKVGLSFVF